MTTVGARAARPHAPGRAEDPRDRVPEPDTTVEVAGSADPLRYGIAAALLLVLGARQFVTVGLTVGIALALVLAPLWLPAVSRYRGGRAVMVCGAVALFAGVWLTEVSTTDHAASLRNLVDASFLLVGILCTAGVVLWARTVMSLRHVGTWFAIGMFVFEVTSDARFSENPWKFAWSLPTTVLLLSLVDRRRGSPLQVAVLLVLAGVSALQDSRSYFAVLVLAALLVVWQLRPTGRRRGSATITALMIGAIAFAVYQVGVSLLLGGYLGSEAQARSLAQVDSTGSLLVGGRPEAAASLAMAQERPWGYGAGVVPSPDDVLLAKSGMASIGYEPNNGYVENYMFGGQIKLHSVLADTWAYYGLAGVALSVLVAGLVSTALVRRIAWRSASGLVTFLGCLTMWNLLFSPLYGSAPTLGLVLGCVLLPGLHRRSPGARRVSALPAEPTTTTRPQT
jgi:hypothetical protein